VVFVASKNGLAASPNAAAYCTAKAAEIHLARCMALEGAPFGIRPVGYRALESLRLEKGYRAWGSDITPNDNPFEAGLGWAVKLKGDMPFVGRAALEAASNKPRRKVLATFTTEREDVVLLGRETILRDGAFAGYLTSGGYGYTIGKPIAYAYLPSSVAEGDVVEISYFGQRIKASVTPEPLYDPQMARLRG